MERRTFMKTAAALSLAGLAGAHASAAFGAQRMRRTGDRKVAFLMGPNATMIDFAGPWEVFQDVHVGNDMPFDLYTVSDSRDPLRVTGGMMIVPDYDYVSAPAPDLIVVPAQGGRSDAKKRWLREASEQAELTMSVCTGAFVLAWAGLLDGKRAATHHDFWDAMEERQPQVKLQRGDRFVVDGKIASAGGLTSGIDLALHVVARLYGRAVAARTAEYMEYRSEAWIAGATS